MSSESLMSGDISHMARDAMMAGEYSVAFSLLGPSVTMGGHDSQMLLKSGNTNEGDLAGVSKKSPFTPTPSSFPVPSSSRTSSRSSAPSITSPNRDTQAQPFAHSTTTSGALVKPKSTHPHPSRFPLPGESSSGGGGSSSSSSSSTGTLIPTPEMRPIQKPYYTDENHKVVVTNEASSSDGGGGRGEGVGGGGGGEGEGYVPLEMVTTTSLSGAPSLLATFLEFSNSSKIFARTMGIFSLANTAADGDAGKKDNNNQDNSLREEKVPPKAQQPLPLLSPSQQQQQQQQQQQPVPEAKPKRVNKYKREARALDLVPGPDGRYRARSGGGIGDSMVVNNHSSSPNNKQPTTAMTMTTDSMSLMMPIPSTLPSANKPIPITDTAGHISISSSHVDFPGQIAKQSNALEVMEADNNTVTGEEIASASASRVKSRNLMFATVPILHVNRKRHHKHTNDHEEDEKALLSTVGIVDVAPATAVEAVQYNNDDDDDDGVVGTTTKKKKKKKSSSAVSKENGKVIEMSNVKVTEHKIEDTATSSSETTSSKPTPEASASSSSSSSSSSPPTSSSLLRLYPRTSSLRAVISRVYGGHDRSEFTTAGSKPTSTEVSSSSSSASASSPSFITISDLMTEARKQWNEVILRMKRSNTGASTPDRHPRGVNPSGVVLLLHLDNVVEGRRKKSTSDSGISSISSSSSTTATTVAEELTYLVAVEEEEKKLSSNTQHPSSSSAADVSGNLLLVTGSTLQKFYASAYICANEVVNVAIPLSIFAEKAFPSNNIIIPATSEEEKSANDATSSSSSSSTTTITTTTTATTMRKVTRLQVPLLRDVPLSAIYAGSEQGGKGTLASDISLPISYDLFPVEYLEKQKSHPTHDDDEQHNQEKQQNKEDGKRGVHEESLNRSLQSHSGATTATLATPQDTIFSALVTSVLPYFGVSSTSSSPSIPVPEHMLQSFRNIASAAVGEAQRLASMESSSSSGSTFPGGNSAALLHNNNNHHHNNNNNVVVLDATNKRRITPLHVVGSSG